MAARDVLLTVLRPSEGARGTLNEPVIAMAPVGRIWAAREDLSDVEAVAAGQEAGARVTRFKMRANTLSLAITSDDALSEALTGAGWNVTGVRLDARGRRRAVIVTGVQRSDGVRA